MPKVVKRTFSLTEEQVKFVDRKVEEGRYASGSEVVRAGLRGLEVDEAVIDKWLREEVLPTIEEYEADPSQLIPLDEAFDMLEREIAEREEHEAPKRRRHA